MKRPSKAQPLIELSAELESMIDKSSRLDTPHHNATPGELGQMKNVLNSESPEAVLLHVALCHNIVIDKRTGKMNSASPDELALVEGTQRQGFSFEGKNMEGVIRVRRVRDQKVLRYKLLNTLEFNSTRKRMSIILRDL